jgi:hypothetical protein
MAGIVAYFTVSCRHVSDAARATRRQHSKLTTHQSAHSQKNGLPCITLRRSTKVVYFGSIKDNQSQFPDLPVMMCSACVSVKHAIIVRVSNCQLNQKQAQ